MVCADRSDIPADGEGSRSHPAPREEASSSTWLTLSAILITMSLPRCRNGANSGLDVMSKPSPELSKVRAQAGALGGKTVTPKKRTHLASIAAKGGATVTEKKREHLRKALAARWAKAKKPNAV